MVIEFSIDDGVELDLKSADLLEKYGFRGMFYIPYARCGLSYSQITGLKESGHSIGSHTMTHPQDLKVLGDRSLDHEIADSKQLLEIVVDDSVDSFCYPRGRFDDRVEQAVRSAGYTEARTVQVGRTKLGWANPYQKPTTVHFYQRAEYGDLTPFEYGSMKFEQAKHYGDEGYFHLWWHSDEVQRYGDWENLEKLLKFVSENQ